MRFLNNISFEKLNSFILKDDSNFNKIFELINHKDRFKYKIIIKYLHIVLDKDLNKNKNDVNYLHYIFPRIDEQFEQVVLEYFVIRFFFEKLDSISKDTENTPLFEILKKDYEKEFSIFNPSEIKLPRYQYLFPTNKTKNRKRKEKKEWESIKLFYKKQIELLEKYPNISFDDINPSTLFNLTKKDASNLIKNSFEHIWYVILLELLDKSHPKGLRLQKRSFNLVNYKFNADELFNKLFKKKELVFYLKNIILFNSHSKSIFHSFNYNTIKDFNTENDISIENLILIDFESKSFSLSRTLNLTDAVTNQYYFKTKKHSIPFYYFHPEELNIINGKTSTETNVHFLDSYGNTVFVQELFELINEDNDLKELFSIKMRNIYSLCFNNTIKSIILDEVFATTNSQILGTITIDAIANLEDKTKDNLKNLLSSLLDSIIKSNIVHLIKNEINNCTTAIINQWYLNNSILLSNLKSVFNGYSINFVSWFNYSEIATNSNLLVLDYRDSGYYFFIKPNIFEIEIGSQFNKSSAFFFDMFFKRNYDILSYIYKKKLYNNIILSDTRKKIFTLNEFKKELQNSKPQYEPNLFFDFNNNFIQDTNRETITIHFTNNKSNKFIQSELFLVKNSKDEFLILRADQLVDKISYGESLSVQKLSEVYNGINLFKTTKLEQKELDFLREKYTLRPEELNAPLWKVLLYRMSKEINGEKIYKDLNEFCKTKNVTLVSKKRFQDDWLNIHSPTLLPRKKDTFLAICEYLNLSKVYYMLMRKKSANKKQDTRDNSSKMINLITQLVKGNYFNNHLTLLDEQFFRKIDRQLDLEEMGITINNFHTELNILINKFKNNLNLIKIVQRENE